MTNKTSTVAVVLVYYCKALKIETLCATAATHHRTPSQVVCTHLICARALKEHPPSSPPSLTLFCLFTLLLWHTHTHFLPAIVLLTCTHFHHEVPSACCPPPGLCRPPRPPPAAATPGVCNIRRTHRMGKMDLDLCGRVVGRRGGGVR